jgi:thiol-disulfide isomerase/thioredoxin
MPDLKRVAAIGLAAFLCLAAATPGPQYVYKLHAGDPFPSFKVITSARGRWQAAPQHKFTLVNFFFADCGTCEREIPMLNEYADLHPQVQRLAVTFDDPKTAFDSPQAHHLRWPMLADARRIVDIVGVPAFPTFALVGPDGRLLAIATRIASEGEPMDAATLSAWVSRSSAAARRSHRRGR